MTEASTDLESSIDKLRVDFDVTKAFNLRYVQGLTYEQIGKLLDVPKSTVHKVLTRFEAFMRSKGELANWESNKVQVLESVLEQMTLDIMDPDKRKKASLNNTAYTFDRVFNALRLLKGESTSNIAHASALDNNLEEIERKIAELEGRVVGVNNEEDVIDAEIAALESDLSDNEGD